MYVYIYFFFFYKTFFLDFVYFFFNQLKLIFVFSFMEIFVDMWKIPKDWPSVLVQFNCTAFVCNCFWEYLYVQGSGFVYLYLLFTLLPLELLEEEVCNGLGPILFSVLKLQIVPIVPG